MSQTAPKQILTDTDQILTDQKNPPSSKNVSKKRKSPSEVEEEPKRKVDVSEVDTLLKEVKEAEDALLEEMKELEKKSINICGYQMPLCHVEFAEKFVKGKDKRKNALLLIKTMGNVQAQPHHVRMRASNQRKVTQTIEKLARDDVKFDDFLSYYQKHGKDFAMYAVHLEDFEKKKKAEKKRKNSVITWDEDGKHIQITKKQMRTQIRNTFGAFDSRYR